jgi:hypothetical protein
LQVQEPVKSWGICGKLLKFWLQMQIFDKIDVFSPIWCAPILLANKKRQQSVIPWCLSLLARQNSSVFTALACSHRRFMVGAVL